VTDVTARAGGPAAPPHTLVDVARTWGLVLGAELARGPHGRVVEATTEDGTRAVLKVATTGVRWEATALLAWRGVGAPALLRHDPSAGALLLERIVPGTPPDGTSADDVAPLLHNLHVAAPDEVPPLAEVVRQRLARAAEERRAPAQKIAWAQDALDELEQDAPPPVLLHGDLDDRNLLACARRGLCAVGPRPCAGDPAYDAGTWVHGSRRPGRRARLDAIVAATGLPRERVRDWAAVVGVHAHQGRPARSAGGV
jgi:streptomycin 6-kinase